MKEYYVEKHHKVIERYRIKAESEIEARAAAKSGDVEPYETVKTPERIPYSWPLASDNT